MPKSKTLSGALAIANALLGAALEASQSGRDLRDPFRVTTKQHHYAKPKEGKAHKRMAKTARKRNRR